MSLGGLEQALQVEALQLEPVIESLVALDWVGRVNEIDEEENSRFVLLADANTTPLEALMRNLLLASSETTDKLWTSGRLSQVYIKDVCSPARQIFTRPMRMSLYITQSPMKL